MIIDLNKHKNINAVKVALFVVGGRRHYSKSKDVDSKKQRGVLQASYTFPSRVLQPSPNFLHLLVVDCEVLDRGGLVLVYPEVRVGAGPQQRRGTRVPSILVLQVRNRERLGGRILQRVVVLPGSPSLSAPRFCIFGQLELIFSNHGTCKITKLITFNPVTGLCLLEIGHREA